jgi:methionyl-tRNA formyltransferase
VVIAFGSSIVKSPLLTHFAGRFLNVHLGLSPYYRGTGTNFWPLVNGEPEFVGATFMHMDAGVDTGLIIHQMRARMFAGDTPHQVGNRMIVDMTLTYVDLVRRLDSVAQMSQPTGIDGRYYRRRDFTPEAVGTMHANFRAGMISKYLADYQGRTSRATIVINPAFQ